MSGLDPSTQRILRELADTVIHESNKPIPSVSKLESVWGIVDSIAAGPPKSLSIFLGGSTFTLDPVTHLPVTGSIRGIKFIASYTPAIGDTVFGLRTGTNISDVVILGAMGGATKSGTPGQVAWAIDGRLAVPHDFPGGFIYVPVGATVKLMRGFGQVQSGSVNITVKDNGVAIAGLTGITVSTSPTPYNLSTPYIVGANHLLTLSTNSGAATGLSFSAYTSAG